MRFDFDEFGRLGICNLLVILLVMAGCDDRRSSSSGTAVEAVTTIDSPGSGSVHGKVTLSGTIPSPAKIDNSICKHAGPIVDESVLAGADGGLANAIVYVDHVRSPLRAISTSRPAELSVLDQKDCRFEPHVQVVRAGQPMLIRNSDAEAHNVHGEPTASPAFNVALPTAGSSKQITLAGQEIIRVKCDVHPWMTAYLGVFDSGYTAVTAADGSFEITGLPPGSYELVAWHERYGELRQTINVNGGATEAKFAYEPPN